MATQDDYIRTALRVPPGLHAQIHEAAKSNNRTFNAEIVARLEQTFSGPVETGSPGLALAVQELQSLQRLGTLTYRLQRATYKADLYRTQMGHAWHQLQDAIKTGNQAEQKDAKAAYEELRKDMERSTASVEAIEAEISAIHQDRKFSGLKELRDVEPVYASMRSGPWVDTGLVTHKDSGKKSKPTK